MLKSLEGRQALDDITCVVDQSSLVEKSPIDTKACPQGKS